MLFVKEVTKRPDFGSIRIYLLFKIRTLWNWIFYTVVEFIDSIIWRSFRFKSAFNQGFFRPNLKAAF